MRRYDGEMAFGDLPPFMGRPKGPNRPDWGLLLATAMITVGGIGLAVVMHTQPDHSVVLERIDLLLTAITDIAILRTYLKRRSRKNLPTRR